MRRVHGAGGRTAHQLLPDARRNARGRSDHHDRGAGAGRALHPLQAAFVERDGFQCGYCTPGQICSAMGMLEEADRGVPSHVTDDVTSAKIQLTDAEIRERMSGNICRCAAYPNILAAIRDKPRGAPHEGLHLRARRDSRPRRQRGSSKPGAKFIAGGTNLLDLMKLQDRAAQPPRRHRSPSARQDRRDSGRRPAHRRHGDEQRSGGRPPCAARYGGLSQAIAVRRLARSCATRRRSAATCCSEPAAPTSTIPPSPATSATPARAARRSEGFNRGHAILGASEHCIADSTRRTWRSRCAALDAEVETVDAGGCDARTSRSTRFHRLPGDTPHIETTSSRAK